MRGNLKAWSESKDYKDLIRAADLSHEYIETQIFSRVRLFDIDRIMVASRRLKADCSCASG